MAHPARRQIDWSSAEVRDGALTVELSGAASKGWSERFEAVRVLLGRSEHEWGEVSLTRKAIEVAGVRQGAEDALRHFLESLVVEVNAGLDPDAQEGSAVATEDPRRAADREMAATFRGFASTGVSA